MKFSLAIVLPLALVGSIVAIALPEADTQTIGANAESDAANLPSISPKFLRGVGTVIGGLGPAASIVGWVHNHFSNNNNQNNGNNKRDTDNCYDGNFFHPDFKAFAAQKGVSIPDVDDFKTFSENAQQYTIQAGDTGLAVAAAHNVTFDQLEDANPFLDWTNLQIGDVLNIPDGGDGDN